ncbi:molybdopterin synthase sulfur carrier subunit [Arthrobacter sp. MYb227]|uniref:MoaD/ThiS family protein n=1 Tax=Arthrobacter sp. MYb227 TaxID=1848601 RepID=UPI000CFB8180|nr:MoaD/ThiS family protein [Arthrobacter sp. MYb227]PQZ90326.1 molybdopterin synthase sulfur carrier subunit [Arthrobacter sp. MYb227]
MHAIIIEVPSVLATTLGGNRKLEAHIPTGASIGSLLDDLGEAYPLFARRVRDERGQVRRFVNIFIDHDNIRALQGLDTVLLPGSTVMIMQSVAGG